MVEVKGLGRSHSLFSLTWNGSSVQDQWVIRLRLPIAFSSRLTPHGKSKNFRLEYSLPGGV